MELLSDNSIGHLYHEKIRKKKISNNIEQSYGRETTWKKLKTNIIATVEEDFARRIIKKGGKLNGLSGKLRNQLKKRGNSTCNRDPML